MNGAAKQRRYTLDDYVALEAHANVEHEYMDGQIWARREARPSTGRGRPT